MSDTLILAIANSTDLVWLEQCHNHNRKLGKVEMAHAAEKRLRDLNLYKALTVKYEANSVEERVLEECTVNCSNTSTAAIRQLDTPNGKSAITARDKPLSARYDVAKRQVA